MNNNRNILPICNPVIGEKVCWSRPKRTSLTSLCYTIFEFTANGWICYTSSWRNTNQTPVTLDANDQRRVNKLLIKNRCRGGMFEYEIGYPTNK